MLILGIHYDVSTNPWPLLRAASQTSDVKHHNTAVLSRLFMFTYLSCHIKRKYAQTKVTNTIERTRPLLYQYDHGVSLITTEEIRAAYAFIQVIFSSFGSC